MIQQYSHLILLAHRRSRVRHSSCSRAGDRQERCFAEKREKLNSKYFMQLMSHERMHLTNLHKRGGGSGSAPYDMTVIAPLPRYTSGLISAGELSC